MAHATWSSGERAQLGGRAEVVQATGEEAKVASSLGDLLLPAGRLGQGEGDEARKAQGHRLEEHGPAHAEPRRHHGSEERSGEDPGELRGLEAGHDPGGLGLAPQREERVVGERLVGSRDERDRHREERLGDDEHARGAGTLP